jgi:hypothetical protein
LLAENELPVADVNIALLVNFLVSEDASGRIVRSVGLERFGSEALLRSPATASTVLKQGLGTRLLTQAEVMASVRRFRFVAAYNDGGRLFPTRGIR